MLLKSNVVAKHFAISVPLHDLSHYFWSVLLQAFFFTDNLTLPSRVDRSSPRTTLLLSIFRNLCPATTTILSFAVLSTPIHASALCPTLNWAQGKKEN